MKIVHEIKYRSLKCLVLAAYFLGQQTGLVGITYNSPQARAERENLVHLLMSL